MSKNIIKEKCKGIGINNNNTVLCHAAVCQRRQRNTECDHDFVSLLHLESLSRVIMYPFKVITTTSFALLQKTKTCFVYSKLCFCHFIIWQERL